MRPGDYSIELKKKKVYKVLNSQEMGLILENFPDGAPWEIKARRRNLEIRKAYEASRAKAAAASHSDDDDDDDDDSGGKSGGGGRSSKSSGTKSAKKEPAAKKPGML